MHSVFYIPPHSRAQMLTCTHTHACTSRSPKHVLRSRRLGFSRNSTRTECFSLPRRDSCAHRYELVRETYVMCACERVHHALSAVLQLTVIAFARSNGWRVRDFVNSCNGSCRARTNTLIHCWCGVRIVEIKLFALRLTVRVCIDW